jgi:IS605 OrfB family transposase
MKIKKKGSHIHLRKCCIRFDARGFKLVKVNKEIASYWLHLSLSGTHGRTAFPIIFGNRRELIEEALYGEYSIKSVEMKKKEGTWYAHFTLSRELTVPNSPEAVIGIDRGEKNFAVAVGIQKDSPNKPRRGMFWKGAEIKALKGRYHHIRRSLGRKKRPHEIKKLKGKLSRKTDQLLHQLANEIVEYATQFKKPVIALEELTHIRNRFQKNQKGRKLNRRMNSLPFRKLQTYIEYKALKRGIAVKYIDPRHTSKQCHRCSTLTNVGFHRTFRCPHCGLIYDRDLNASINIAHRITSSLGWGTRECPEQPNDVSVVKT